MGSYYTLNGFITRRGSWRDVGNGQHAINRKRADAIRMSCPERRRTWYGIEAYASTTPDAWRTLLGKLRLIQFAHVGITFQHGDKVIELQAGDNFANLRRYIRARIAEHQA